MKVFISSSNERTGLRLLTQSGIGQPRPVVDTLSLGCSIESIASLDIVKIGISASPKISEEIKAWVGNGDRCDTQTTRL